MLVICAGMFRACSTWQYNVASDLLERHRQGKRLGYGRLRDLGLAAPPTGWSTLKLHDAEPELGGYLSAGRAVALYSHRDLRDVACSLAHKFGEPIDAILAPGGLLADCLRNDAFWRSQEHVLVQQYDDLRARPSQGIAELAAHLQLRPGLLERWRLSRRYSLAANKKHTQSVAQSLERQGLNLSERQHQLAHDPRSLFHWNHLRDGRTGGWRQLLTRSQAERLLQLSGNWLVRNGYERDQRWVDELPSQPVSRAA